MADPGPKSGLSYSEAENNLLELPSDSAPKDQPLLLASIRMVGCFLAQVPEAYPQRVATLLEVLLTALPNGDESTTSSAGSWHRKDHIKTRR